MSARDPVLERLRALRPSDPRPGEGERAAVRVLARLAVMEAGQELAETSGASVARPSATRRSAALAAAWAAACLLVLLAVPAGRSRAARPAPVRLTGTHLTRTHVTRTHVTRTHVTRAQAAFAQPPLPLECGSLTGGDPAERSAPDAWRSHVAAALGGDAVARMHLLRGGASGRAALLRAAQVGGVRGRAALMLLRQGGPLRSEAEAQAVADLVAVLGLQRPALELLAGARGSAGMTQLAAVLVTQPALEADAVRALGVVAARGRPEEALRALLPGAAAGRRLAAAGAFAIAGPPRLARVTATVPAQLLGDPAVVAAVREAPVATRAALVRMAAAGDTGAQSVAARARLSGIVPVLASDALVDDPGRAGRAVSELARHGGVDAWLAVGRALDGSARARAADVLWKAPAAALAALAARARASARDAPAALVALAAAGKPGVAQLATLASETRLANMAVAALATASSGAARDALAVLAQQPSLAVDAIEALGRRLAAGDEAAGEALLGLARERPDRAAFRALESGGAPGRVLLERAGQERGLERRARASLGQDTTERTAGRTTPALRRTATHRWGRARSI